MNQAVIDETGIGRCMGNTDAIIGEMEIGESEIVELGIGKLGPPVLNS